jgi:hypothetical protein
MKVVLDISSDSHNTYVRDKLEIFATDNKIFLKIEDRELGIGKEEFLRAIKILCI